jgi:hypothetical protein
VRSDAFSQHRVEFPNDDGYLTLGDLVDGYAVHVGMFEESCRPNDWGDGDLQATLHLRDRLERARRLAPPDVRDELLVELEALDRRLRDATEDDADGHVLRDAGELRPASAWWWRRLPVAGLARAELLGGGRAVTAAGGSLPGRSRPPGAGRADG